jgi:hypothetical protein
MSEFNNVKVPFFHDMLHALSVTISLLACYVYLEPICTLMYCFLSIIRHKFFIVEYLNAVKMNINLQNLGFSQQYEQRFKSSRKLCHVDW